MSFEEVLRQKISGTKSKVGRSVLKVALGEFQQKNANGKATEQDGLSVVEKIINGNRETLAVLKQEDARRADLEEEIVTLSSLLPTYLTADEVLEKVRADSSLFGEVNTVLSQGDKTRPVEDPANAKLVGRATGSVVKFFKSANIAVKGDTVKEALSRLFRE
jgi:uncharacterized protein YqeY